MLPTATNWPTAPTRAFSEVCSVKNGVKAARAHLRICIGLAAQQFGIFAAFWTHRAYKLRRNDSRALVVVSDDLRFRDAVGLNLPVDQKSKECRPCVARRTAAIDESAPALSRIMAAAFDAIAASIRLSWR